MTANAEPTEELFPCSKCDEQFPDAELTMVEVCRGYRYFDEYRCKSCLHNYPKHDDCYDEDLSRDR